MSTTEIALTCIAFGVLVLVACAITALGLCRAAGREAPHPEEYACNGGLTDEEMESK